MANKHKGITIKERKLIKGKIAGLSTGQAAMEAGYSSKNPDQSGCRALAKPSVQAAFDEELDKAGLTIKKIVEKLKEKMECTQLVGKNAIEHPDNNAQLKALDIAIKVKGGYAPERHAVVTTTLAELIKELGE